MKSIEMEKRMEHFKVNGLSIASFEKGHVNSVENYGFLEVNRDRKVDDNSIFNACSISKFVTGMLVIKLSEEDYLDLDEDVNERLVTWKVPENEYTKYKKVTLRSLLSHQSGITDPENSFFELNAEIGIPSMMELLKGSSPYCKDPIQVRCEPESEFHYSDAGYCIIQQLIEDVMEQPFHQVVDRFLFGPQGMKSSLLNPKISEVDIATFSCGHNKNGQLVEGKYPIYPYPAASGLWTTSLDLAELVLELVHALKGKSKLGISNSAAKEMITPQLGNSWSGLGVFLESEEKELEITSLGWGVGFQSMMVFHLPSEKGAVIMTNAELGVHQMEGIIGEVSKSIFF